MTKDEAETLQTAIAGALKTHVQPMLDRASALIDSLAAENTRLRERIEVLERTSVRSRYSS